MLMEGIVGLVCCILCAFPLFVMGYYNKNSREPLTFWVGDKGLTEKVKVHWEYMLYGGYTKIFF